MLQIIKIKASRISNRINISFSDNTYIPLFIDDIVKLSLSKNKDVDPQKLEEIIQSSFSYLGREYALRQIAISPKTEKILSQKLKIYFLKALKKYKVFIEIDLSSLVENIITELKSRNLLNKEDFIHYFIRKNRHKSIMHITLSLAQQDIKIDPDLLKELLPQNDSLLIKKYLDKKRINSKDLKDFNYRQKIFASLYRRGFNLTNIKDAIDDYSKLK